MIEELQELKQEIEREKSKSGKNRCFHSLEVKKKVVAFIPKYGVANLTAQLDLAPARLYVWRLNLGALKSESKMPEKIIVSKLQIPQKTIFKGSQNSSSVLANIHFGKLTIEIHSELAFEKFCQKIVELNV